MRAHVDPADAADGNAAKWHDFQAARWTIDEAPDFSVAREVAAVEPIYEDELDAFLQLVCQRNADAVRSATGPAFAFVADARQAYLRMAAYRLNWRRLRPDDEYPPVVGWRVGGIDDPSTLSFSLGGFRTGHNGIRIWLLSSVDVKASLAIFEAATEAARSAGGDNVGILLSDPGALADTVTFRPAKDVYGFQCVETHTRC